MASPTSTPAADLAAEGALSVREAARLLGVSERATYRLVWDGDLRHARVGRRVVIPRRAVTDYLASAIERTEAAS